MSCTQVALERRHHPRFAVRANAIFEWNDHGVPHRGCGHVENISLKGMRIVSDDKPPVAALLFVIVRFNERVLPRAVLELNVRGRVLRTSPAEFALFNKDFEIQPGNDLGAVAEALAMGGE